MTSTAPLTKTQYGIYAECISHGGEPCYNIPYLYILDGSLDGEQLRKAIEAAVKAHPTLFTRIELNSEGEPIQSIDDNEAFELQMECVDNGSIDEITSTFVKPFDLYNDRLFRIRLLKDTEHYYLLQDIHHIISDGTTRRVLLNDIEKAYCGEALEPEELSLCDVAKAEDELRKSPAFEEAKQWYASHFDCGDC